MSETPAKQQTDEGAGALVPRGAKAIVVPTNRITLPMLNGESRSIVTSFDPDNAEDKLRLFAAVSDIDVDLREHLEKPFAVEHYLVHPASKVNEVSGELEEFSQTVLIGPDGTRHGTFSDWVQETLMLAVLLFGAPPWKPAREFVMRSRTTQKKRTMFYLDVVRAKLPKAK